MFRTLLVEDSVGFRSTLHGLLHERFPGIEIFEAGTGEEALAVTVSYHPELVLMDINLPGENGLELTRKIKDIDAAISVIILTSFDLPEYREAAFSNGASDFLCKETVSPGDILALIQNALITHTPH
jgi:DNA-binding NarL/FixJ family response regulator